MSEEHRIAEDRKRNIESAEDRFEKLIKDVEEAEGAE